MCEAAHLRLASGIFIVRRLSGHLLEHLVEAHIDYRVCFDEPLEFLDNGMERLIATRRMLDLFYLLRQPGLEHVVVHRQPLTNAMVHMFRRHWSCDKGTRSVVLWTGTTLATVKDTY